MNHSASPVRQPPPWLIVLSLAVVTLLTYHRIGQCGFVNLDDDAYVEFQPLVNQGIRPATVVWAFAAAHSGMWHPLTTLSHALDCSMFGVRAQPMHWVNLGLHLFNVGLVFWLWQQAFGGRWRAAAVAAVFALHPLNVESVAWISERKNLLSTSFWLIGLGAYVYYSRRPSIARYAAVFVALSLGLMSKPMMVTFPAVLLLLDFWPLARWPRTGAWLLLREKIPLLALSAILSVITLLAQGHVGATTYGQRFTLAERLANALVAYSRYLGKLLWPESLAPFYWHPGAWPVVPVVGAAALLAAISVLAFRTRRSRPWILFGWLWFLGTLVPVIGLVQSGAQSMADRYMYVPMLGLLTILAWEAAALAKARGTLRAVTLAAAMALAAGAVLTARQVGAWRNSITLYEHSIAAGEDNPAVRYLLAMASATAGKPEGVIAQFHRALELRPDYVNALTQLASIAMANGRFDEAAALIEKTVQFEPDNPAMPINRGALALRLGQPDEAIRHFENALRLDPTSATAHLELGKIYINRQRWDEARIHYAARARLDRWNAEAQCDYGTLLANMGPAGEGLPYLERAVWLNPKHERAQQNLAALKERLQSESLQPSPKK